ncbi:MAG: hypothetical protein LBO09_02500 [Candidatus Peribacteria bacterium]|jgi:hypothetical protein|nr:hypothetical protein [Candidatus Peribacteria bacterium]
MSSYLNLPAGENFALNASKDIKFEGDYITMTGIVKGKSFTMRTNRNATAKLETSDFLADANPETPNATAFTVGSNNFQKTPYDMPNTKVWDTIKSTQQTLRAKEMEKEKPDLKQYQIDLQQRLHEEIQKLYNENDRKELVQIRMERQVEKEVLNQEFFAGFSTLMELTARPPSFLDKATASPQVLNFFRKFDQFQEDASIDQLKMRRQCMNELIPMLVAKKHPEQSSTNKNACKLFAHIDPDMINNTKDMLKGNVEKTPNLFEGVFSMILPLETENANTEYSSSTTRAKLVDLQQALKDKDGKKGTDEYKILGQWYKEKYVDDDLGSSYDEASKEGGNE